MRFSLICVKLIICVGVLFWFAHFEGADGGQVHVIEAWRSCVAACPRVSCSMPQSCPRSGAADLLVGSCDFGSRGGFSVPYHPDKGVTVSS